jgi:hypothetical protein
MRDLEKKGAKKVESRNFELCAIPSLVLKGRGKVTEEARGKGSGGVMEYRRDGG